MATSIDPPVRRVRRVWVPVTAVLLAGVAVPVLMFAELGLERMHRNFYSALSVMIAVLVTLVWLVAFSGLAWRLRVLLPLLLAAGLALTVERVNCNGNMGPVFIWRWSQVFNNPDERIEAHRAKQNRPAGLVVDLTAETEADFPAYRGVLRDGIVRGGPALATDWNVHPPRRLWGGDEFPVGGGYAAFSAVGDFLVTIEQRRDNEAVVCYHAPTGTELWKHEYPATYTDMTRMGGPGPRATPTVYAGDVFSLGAGGRLVCLDGKTGALKWGKDILEGNDNVTWGMSGSPLVYDDVVVVNPGAQKPDAPFGKSLAAFNRTTGDLVWSGGDTNASYSSPMLATIAGVRQILLVDAEVVAGYDAKSGTRLWSYPWTNQQKINVAQPLALDGDRVFIASGYNSGSAMLKISHDGEWKAEELWRERRVMRCKFTTPVYYEGFIYGLDEGALQCVDAATGQVRWTQGDRPGKRRDDKKDYEHGQILLAGNRIIVLTEKGRLVLVEATPDGHRELGGVHAVEGKKTWNNPAVARGKLYVRNNEEMAGFDITAP
jgi:outer membrane protein assembly factor BamB